MSRPYKNRGFAQPLHAISSTQKERLGTLRITQDGRKFRYALAGASALSMGKIGACTGAGVTAQHDDTAQTSYGWSAGDRMVQIVITAGVAIAENEYSGGYLYVNDVTNYEGLMLEIEGNAAASASDALLYVELAEASPMAVAATGEVSLIRSPWYKTTETGAEEVMPAGVPLVDVTAAYYYWAQTGGMANVLMNGNIANGTTCVMATPAGSVAAATATTLITYGRVGRKVLGAGADTEYDPVWLTID